MMPISPEAWTAEHQHRTERLARSARPHPPPIRRREQVVMDTHSATARFDAALSQQLALAADPAVEAAGEALRATLGPAARQLAMELAEQAATEVAAQLPDHEVDVVLRDGEPALAVRLAAGSEEPATDEDLEARITLRLPPSLKARLEEAAGSVGDSVNSYVVKALSTRAARASGPGRRVTGTVQT